MRKLLHLLILRNYRSIGILFFVILLASTGLVTILSLIDNIESAVADETRPLFGADLRISHQGATSRPILETFSVFLSGTTYRWGEIKKFSTTLLATDGKPGLVEVIAYRGEYPQRGILETVSLQDIEPSERVSVSDDLWNKYGSGGSIIVDGRSITITDRIVKSSDLGFSFASENALIILPVDVLSGSLLLSSGSRLSQDLLVSFARESDAELIQSQVGKDTYPDYRIRTYSDRSEQTLDITRQLSDYILLIVLVSTLFAGIILRSAHDRFFVSLSKTLSVVEILGLTRRRQMILFALIYTIILPFAFVISLGLSWSIIWFISTFPEAEGFRFSLSVIPFSFSILALIVLLAFFPAWRSRFLRDLLSRRIGGVDILFLCTTIICLCLIVYLIFERFIFSLIITLVSLGILAIVLIILRVIYRIIFSVFESRRYSNFTLYDGLRSHIRPLIPTLAITTSLVAITTFFVVFALFSLSFRSKLVIDTQSSANIYAVNILESDRERVQIYLSGSGDMYSILRARIRSINGKTLEQHLGVEKVSGEFTREFNITTSPLESSIIIGKDVITAGEVSVDNDFRKRLDIDIGDTIVFLLSGREVSLTVANVRTSKREGFAPFFYFSFDPVSFARAPKTYFASAYAADTNLWKKGVLANSGPHVTFIDIENILEIVRDVSSKVIAVIGLFLTAVSIFAIFAIVALFGQMVSIDQLKMRLYPLFGMLPREVMTSLTVTRVSIYIISFVLSVILAGGIYMYLMSTSTFINLTYSSVLISLTGVIVVYVSLIVILRPR